jgi:hypothetical protein
MKNHKDKVEVCFADYGKDETEIKNVFMSSCAMNDDMFVNTAGMSNDDTTAMCAMQYMKMRAEMLETGDGGLTEKQKNLPPALKKAILERMKKQGELSEEGEKEMGELDATQIAVFPDKYVPVKDVGTPFEDTRPINKEGYKIDEEIKRKAEQSKLKNPDLQSANPPQE